MISPPHLRFEGLPWVHTVTSMGSIDFTMQSSKRFEVDGRTRRSEVLTAITMNHAHSAYLETFCVFSDVSQIWVVPRSLGLLMFSVITRDRRSRGPGFIFIEEYFIRSLQSREWSARFTQPLPLRRIRRREKLAGVVSTIIEKYFMRECWEWSATRIGE